MDKRSALMIFFCIFALSGFSGLIYESIWTHYLKLFLGHASYAQVLVLSIFMGGMAIGSALAAKLSGKLTNLIIAYGIIEGVIGIFGLTFHPIFTSVQELSFESILPNLGAPWLVHTVKWSIGALLILPQSILLGATFPLLSAGLIRRFSENSGKTLATLYFINSFGASLGILFNTFYLVPKVGLPGSVLTAGIINIVLAIFVYYLSKEDHFPAVETSNNKSTLDNNLVRYLFVIASLTGLASFMYEIAWIRMLTMVLGGSTHSFEIMLSAFILGLAIGGLWIRKRIDHLENPILTLGLIQILMGTLAILTIPLYGIAYELMGFAMEALSRSDSGYLLYSLFSYGISLVIMLPATICAGTTLPLVTYILLKNGSGDSAIGKTYAWNTVGAIIGVVLAVHLVTPLLGLKWVILIGGLVDLVLGFFIIYRLHNSPKRSQFKLPLAISCLVIFFYISLTNLDIEKMASGIFRYGLIKHSVGKIIFYKDGKTSSVAIRQNDENTRSITNNGKPDASLIMGEENNTRVSKSPYTPDQSTMVLLGTLPYVYKDEVEHVANIGLGSGLTAHALLHNKSVKSVDTIEIEQAVFEAANFFRPNVENIFTDERSHVIIEDAKTYFAVSGKKYDAIVSEPPNPWVSGVSGLFSTEFYHNVNRYLSDDGVFIQWMHLYEISPPLVATVFSALNENFTDIRFYQVSPGDIAIVAANFPLTSNYERPFQHSGLKNELANISILKPNDLLHRKLASKDKLSLIFAPFGSNSNSDYFPILDHGAANARFKKNDAMALYQMQQSKAIDVLTNEAEKPNYDLTIDPLLSFTSYAKQNADFSELLETYLSKGIPVFVKDEAEIRAKSLAEVYHLCRNSNIQHTKTQNGNDIASQRFIDTTYWATSFSNNKSQLKLFAKAKDCKHVFNAKATVWLNVNKAWLNKDFAAVANLSDDYFKNSDILSQPFEKQLLIFKLASHLAAGIPIDTSRLDEMVPQAFLTDIELKALLFHIDKSLFEPAAN